MMLAMNRSPLFGNHAGGEPEPKTEEMRNHWMQIQGTVCLAAMQKDGDRCNSDVGNYQSKNGNLPPKPIEVAIG